MTEIKIKLLKEMHNYIIEMGDEDIYMDWVTLAVPDEPSEEDFEFIAEHNENWVDACTLFGKLVKADIENNY